MQEVTLFIPRILPSVNQTHIKDQFLKEKIGYCSKIKAKNRINENGFRYWFAFITIQFFDTPNAHMFYQKVVEEDKMISMEYMDQRLGQPRYWDISLRNLDKKANLRKRERMEPLEEGEIYETCFGEEERKEIYEDYLEIERDIFGYHYNIYGCIM